MKKLILVSLVVVLAIAFSATPSLAQCPMCKAAVETSLASGSNVAIGINKGILYLLVMPYILYATIFLSWYYKRKKAIAAGA